MLKASFFNKFIVFVFTYSTFGIVFSGTLSCSVTTAAACTGGTNVVILRMSGPDNAHAELPSQSNAAYASNVVCCSGVTNLGTSCSGTYATALKLSWLTNAHVELGTQTNYNNSACIQAPVGWSVTVGYGTSCTGYDTTLASMSHPTTNAHIWWPAAYTNKICATATGAWNLTLDIVDAGGTTVGSPTMSMATATLSLQYQSTSGTLWVSSQKIRVTNGTGSAQWSASIAATLGSTALWSAGTPKYDFNDPTANAVDGADADSYGGRMSIDPSVSTLTPQSGCTNTGITKWSSSAFSQGVTDSITIVTAGSTSGTNCYWDITGITVSQTIPLEQAVSSYTLDMTLTVTAI